MSRRSSAVACTALAGALVALAGCAGIPRPDAAPPPPRVVYVDRLVIGSCLAANQIPTMPAPVGTSLNGEAHHDAELLAAALLTARGWMGEAAALLSACAGPLPATAPRSASPAR